MPKYEFRCHCGQEKELESPITLDRVVLPTCICGKTMRRKFSAPAIVFKGDGFYKTSK